MPTFSILELFESDRRFRFRGLEEVANGCGVELRAAVVGRNGVESEEQAWGELAQFIETSDSFYLPSETVLLVPQYLRALQQKVQQGKRLCINADINSEELMNTFLAPFDLTVSRIKLSASSPHVVLTRSDNALIDEQLFHGVEQVSLQSPLAIWTGGASKVSLKATDSLMTIRADQDLPSDFPAEEVACIGRWDGANGGAVIVLDGHAFHDPYTGPTGITWSGISDNQQFATNLIRFLCKLS